MPVAIRQPRAETEDRTAALLRSVGPAIERLGVDRDKLIRDIVSARSSAVLAAYQLREGTTLPAAEAFEVLLPPNAEATGSADTEKGFERAYARLGLWAGRYSSRSGVKSEIDFWKASGREGASWLAQRIRTESGNDTLNAVANVLSSLGNTALSMILGYLQANPTPDQAYCLLDALGRMGRQCDTASGRTASIIERYLSHRDPDVRQAAISATAALPRAKSLEILRSALASEHDPAVTKGIREEIADRAAE